MSEQGEICLDLLREKWSPSLSTPTCLDAVRLMLAHPNPDDALRQLVAELTIADRNTNGKDTQYAERARQCTLQEASKSVAQWRKEWEC